MGTLKNKATFSVAFAAASLGLVALTATPASASTVEQIRACQEASASDICFFSGTDFTGTQEYPSDFSSACVATEQKNQSIINVNLTHNLTLYANADCTGQAYRISNLGTGNHVYGGFLSYHVS